MTAREKPIDYAACAAFVAAADFSPEECDARARAIARAVMAMPVSPQTTLRVQHVRRRLDAIPNDDECEEVVAEAMGEHSRFRCPVHEPYTPAAVGEMDAFESALRSEPRRPRG